ncbi:MAG: cyclic nucleotide-binding domain-containing protein [Leptospiraceae bacterium]|nr:cyclic nucleotide-binding domain-containing protein [Leptospiraceae bacterium]MCP5493498.1 cyclic nucleotide-binding domain-containing protein [Leptospiraceae bacterium]
MAGPVIRTYKAGSIIYFEKDKAEEIFVLQNGRIALSYTSIDNHVEVKEEVKKGEFFGVKSALGKYPREETAQVLMNSSVLVFKYYDFEEFVANKTHLILKMMKVFSNQLRQIHSKVREQLGQLAEARSPSYELMNVGEVFYQNEEFGHAIYAFKRYLHHYPGGKYSQRAQELLNLAEKNSPFPTHLPPLVYEVEKPTARSDSGGPASASQIQESSLSFKDLFNKGLKFFNSKNFNEAFPIYKSLVEKQVATPEEAKLQGQANFYYGICQKNLGKTDASYTTLSLYVKNFPKGEKVKEAILNLAQISEQRNDVDKAILLYNKVAMMPPGDQFTLEARKKAAQLKG